MKAVDLALSVLAAVTVMAAAYAFDRVEQQTTALRVNIVECASGRKTCEAERAKERTVCDQAQKAIANADYFIWEVHEVDIQHNPYDPKDDGQLEELCKKLSDHSVLSLDAELNAYSLWGDGAGHQKLGCRYVKRHQRIWTP